MNSWCCAAARVYGWETKRILMYRVLSLFVHILNRNSKSPPFNPVRADFTLRFSTPIPFKHSITLPLFDRRQSLSSVRFFTRSHINRREDISSSIITITPTALAFSAVHSSLFEIRVRFLNVSRVLLLIIISVCRFHITRLLVIR